MIQLGWPWLVVSAPVSHPNRYADSSRRPFVGFTVFSGAACCFQQTPCWMGTVVVPNFLPFQMMLQSIGMCTWEEFPDVELLSQRACTFITLSVFPSRPPWKRARSTHRFPCTWILTAGGMRVLVTGPGGLCNWRQGEGTGDDCSSPGEVRGSNGRRSWWGWQGNDDIEQYLRR